MEEFLEDDDLDTIEPLELLSLRHVKEILRMSKVLGLKASLLTHLHRTHSTVKLIGSNFAVCTKSLLQKLLSFPVYNLQSLVVCIDPLRKEDTSRGFSNSCYIPYLCNICLLLLTRAINNAP